MSKVLDQPLKVRSLKIYDTVTSQHSSDSELFFLTAQSAAFTSKKQYRYKANTYSQSVSGAQITSSAKNYENNSDIEHNNAQRTEFQKTFDPNM